MKKASIPKLGLIFLACLFSACTGVQNINTSGSDRPLLDQWLNDYAFGKIVEQLKSNTFMKNRPFLVARIEGESAGRDIGHRIDKLSEAVRERMVTFFLEYPEIRVIRRHPASSIDRPYTLQELRCGRFVEPEILIAMNIRRLGDMKDRRARVSIRAVDLESNEWVRGFSLYRDVELTGSQSKELSLVHPDQHLKGLKYAPFEFSQRDEMGAYLAGNLSCMFNEAYDGEAFKVFVDDSKSYGQDKDIFWFIKKQLQFCNEIHLTNSRADADWILEAESKRTGSGTGLSQFWIEVYRKENGALIRGLTTFAYYLSFDGTKVSISGKWKIKNLPDGSISGFMRITGNRDQGLRGDLFGSDGVSLIKRGIYIENKEQHVDWAYYDDRFHKTMKARGLLIQDGKKMSVQVTSYPPDGRFKLQEFLLEEVH